MTLRSVVILCLLLLAGSAHGQSLVLCRLGVTGSQSCASPLALSYIPTIPAATGLSGVLPVPHGGTGRSSFTVGAIPFASSSTTIAELTPTEAGYLLTDNGPGLAPSFQEPAAAEVISNTLVGTYNVTTTTYASVGVPVSLTAGRWTVTCEARTLVLTSAGFGFPKLRLYNTTDAAAIPNTQRAGPLTGASGQPAGGTVPVSVDVTLTGPKTIDLQAARDSVAVYTTLEVIGDPEGYTVCTARRKTR